MFNCSLQFNSKRKSSAFQVCYLNINMKTLCCYISIEKKLLFQLSLSNFRIPSEDRIRKQWINAIESHQKFDYTISDFRVCQLHFTQSNVFSCTNRTLLSRGSIPTLFDVDKM